MPFMPSNQEMYQAYFTAPVARTGNTDIRRIQTLDILQLQSDSPV